MPKELSKGQIIDGEITGLTSDGAGVCRAADRAIFVPRALPGERWRIRIVKVNKSVVWGRGEGLLLPSPDRCDPVCPVYGKCGGCATLHMDSHLELAFKRDRVDAALQRIGGLSLRAERIIAAPERYGYRNKAIYNFAPGPVCGFFRGRSHDVVSTDHCFLQPEAFDRAAASLLQWMQATNVPAYDEKEGTGLIRHLFLRKSSKDMMACIVATGPLRGDVVDALRAGCPELTGVLLCRNDAPGNVVMTNDIQVLWGSDTVEEALCGARFLLSPNTFFQVNTAQTETLYSIVGQYAQPAGKTVLDLYCGAGTIGLSVAREAKRIIGNDITPSAIENAARNAALNGIQAEYYCGDARDIARKLAQDGLRPDVIITDPPRKGMDETVLSALVTMAPDTIVYVSCDPGTLARDLKRLSEKGYAATACTAVDMFPGTKHVETVVALSKR